MPEALRVGEESASGNRRRVARMEAGELIGHFLLSSPSPVASCSMTFGCLPLPQPYNPYNYRPPRSSVQQGLSSANGFGALARLGGAADKRYLLGLP